MRIPASEGLGNRVADVPSVPRAAQGDGGIGAAGELLAKRVTAYADDAVHEARQQQAAAQKAQAALTLATINNEAHDAHDEVARGVVDGSIPTDKAESELQARIDRLRDDRLKPLDEVQRGAIADNLVNTQGTLMRNLRGVVVKRQQSETGATIDAFGEQTARDVLRIGPAKAADRYDAVVDLTASGAGWAPELVGKKKQLMREQLHYTYFDSLGTEALTRGDAAGVGKVLEQVNGPAGEALDSLKRVQLTHQLFGYQQHILARDAADANAAEQERVRRENTAADAFNRALDISVSGGQLSPDFIREVVAAGQGTSHEADIAGVLRSQTEVSGFATKTADQRAAILDRWRADRATPGVGTNPATEKMLAGLSAIDGRLREKAKDDPWEAALGAGRIAQVPALDLSSPSAAIASLQSRMRSIGDVETWAGGKISPLRPAEADQVGKFARALPVDQAASMLGQFGAALGDADRVAALTRQVHDKDGTLGLAMAYANTQTTQGRYTAELVLRGDQLVKDKAVAVDGAKETGWRAEIAKQVRGAYSNRQAEDQVVNAAFLIAAAKGGDIDNAVRLATGGGVIDFNGSRVPMPVGYAADGGQSGAEDRFRAAIAAIPPDQLAPQVPDGKVYAAGVPMRASDFLASLPKAQLVHAGAGVYSVKAGNTLVTNGQGRRITIKLP